MVLTAVGYVYSKNAYIFSGLGTHKEKGGGYWPVIVKTPNIDKDGVIRDYQPAWRYHVDNGYAQLDLWTGGPKNFAYDDLRDLITKYKYGESREQYLSKVNFYEFGGKIEKINSFIPWEVYSLIGIWLAFFVVFKRKALTVFFIWWWCTIWRYISMLGFYAYWNGPLDSYNLVFAILNQPLKIYVHSLSLSLIEYHLLWAVPLIHLIKLMSHITIDGTSSYFKNVENKLSFKSNKQRKRRVNHVSKAKFTLPN